MKRGRNPYAPLKVFDNDPSFFFVPQTTEGREDLAERITKSWISDLFRDAGPNPIQEPIKKTFSLK